MEVRNFLMLPLLVITALWGGWLYCPTFADHHGLCRSLDFSVWIEGHALQGHVIKNLSLHVGPSLGIACRHRCVMDPVCVSVNAGPIVKDRYICELSDSDHMRDYKDIELREGFMYMGTENPCFSEPCLHNGSCLTGFTNKKYLCECQTGYMGEQCEKEINPCESNPCMNNGTCIEKVNGFNCSCPLGFSGERCEKESSGGASSSSKAFIFSLRNKEGLGPFKSNVTNLSKAIYRISSSGPTFGGGHDIRIANNANSNTDSYTHFGNSYSVPSGVQDKQTILAGTYTFTPDDWEVFYLG